MNRPHVSLLLFAVLLALTLPARAADVPVTERKYLSGHGPKDAVPWQFTITGGRRAGEKTTIPVPSNWEQQGFGSYQYGQQKVKTHEHGLYHTEFTVPEAWKGRRIWLVFEGVMTDTTATVNGTALSPTHQGGFYRFRYDVTKRVKFDAANALDVDVAKVSSDPDVEGAERTGDYWVFGGIYRPVWLEAAPAQAIDHVAIAAEADGRFGADVALSSVKDADRVEVQVLDANGAPLGEPFDARLPAGGTGRITVTHRFTAPQLWTAETPYLYTARFTLRRGAEALHVIDQRFGFRTFEVRPGAGLFLNGHRVVLKGVNRHSFRPETARALNPEDCYDDARLIREMNMNAVRMSHYPPDPAFLDACDELGLYVLDELTGWHHAYDTATGRGLVREMVERDVNHPSILFWDNGNEGGNNRDLDGEFARFDPQHRTVLHPWDLFNGVNTKHYPNYEDFLGLLRGRDPVMPTEFLHGLYDGGGGAALEDYWRAITASPVGGGGIIWVFADEGVVRTDLGGKVDVFSTFAPDGIVGPHHEKEGSFFTIRDLWSPVQIDPPVLDERFDGTLQLHNRYDITSLAGGRLAWQLLRYPLPPGAAPQVLAQGAETLPDIPAQHDGGVKLALPTDWAASDVLVVTAYSPAGAALWTWAWPTRALSQHVAAAAPVRGDGTPSVERHGDRLELRGGATVAQIDPASGLLAGVVAAGRAYALTHGPRLVFARPAMNAPVTWLGWSQPATGAGEFRVAQPGPANVLEFEVDDLHGAEALSTAKLEISADGQRWTTVFDASRRPQDGARYEFPPQVVAAVRVSHLSRYDGKPPVLKTFRVGYAAGRFPALPTAPGKLSTGTSPASASSPATAWVQVEGGPSGLDRVRWTMRPDGSLVVAFAYHAEGDLEYHGITFDLPEAQLRAFRWLGQGPYRVWQNRLRGTTFGVYQHDRHVTQPGESWDYPEFEGYFAGARWTDFLTDAGTVSALTPIGDLFLRVGSTRDSAATVSPDFPAGEVSWLFAIPPMMSKGSFPGQAGPSSHFAQVSGTFSGEITFRFADERER